uniref:Uncharacterized protein n=1 Tax=Peronospora matthiolae TaxID=2874970 RepID=A0AAV1V7T7_9STRA
MSPNKGDKFANSVLRAAAASMARRSKTQRAAQTPPAGSSDHSSEEMRPELDLMMEQQAAMVSRLEELEQRRLELPRIAGNTFEPVDTTRSRATVPVLRPTATFRSPSMRMTHVRPMEVDDLHDMLGTESRVRDASVRTERRALRQ